MITLPPPRRRDRGQIVPLTALMLMVLIGLTALAIDLSAGLLAERSQRSIADAAALAGAQSLQIPGTRLLPTAAEQTQARTNAMQILQSQLGGTAGAGDCFSAAGCELSGTPYRVSVRTPSPSCVDCAPQRAVQVSVWQPNFGLTFGRIFSSALNVRSTSVAGMVIAPQYGLVTLRPSKLRPSGSDANYDDLKVTGGSKVVVDNADIATNSNATCSGASSGSEIVVESSLGFNINHFGAGPYWTASPGECLNPPTGFQLTTLVEDPAYPIPQRDGSVPVYSDSGLASAQETGAACTAEQAKVPVAYKELKTGQTIQDPAKVTVTCYRPGIYQKQLVVKDPTSGLPNVALLLPGVYYFDAGLEVSSTILGGYVPNQPGVALVFKEAKNASGIPGQFLTKTNTSLVALNFGDAYCPLTTCPGGRWATPANGPAGLVETPGPNSQLLTVMVEPDASCAVVAPPPTACRESENQTLKLTGGGNIYLAGVQYAPSDNAALTGSSGQKSDVGAFWAWTLEFNGGTTFNLTSNKPQSAGVLRLDPACSPNVGVCNP